jgi:sugar phosphate isomerase/epimerase
MGEGCIDIKQIRGWVEDAGFNGYNEVEVFSTIHWQEDQHQYFDRIIRGYMQCT